MERDIKRVWSVKHENRGPGHTAGFLLEPGNWEAYDPFLLMAEDWFEKGRFDFHPHRGIETVTYVIEGNLEHKDTNGGSGLLGPGDAQLMTAGKGVLHAEEPPEGEEVHTLQLWINLPSKDKMTEPRYQDLRKEAMPVYQEKGVHIRVFSGAHQNVKAATLNHVPFTMVEIALEAGAEVRQALPGSYNGFIYVLEGKGEFGSKETPGEKNQVLWLGEAAPTQESSINIKAKEQMKVLLYAGEPVKEPVVARGPFVMNTEEQIRQAYVDYQRGKFHK